eukprot:7456841-Pyramimonas_sp.AAC.1
MGAGLVGRLRIRRVPRHSEQVPASAPSASAGGNWRSRGHAPQRDDGEHARGSGLEAPVSASLGPQVGQPDLVRARRVLRGTERLGAAARGVPELPHPGPCGVGQ